MAAQPGWTPPDEFDEYRLLKRLGHGSMGQVWLAHDTVLDRPVAIKFLATQLADAAMRERFLVEARAVARLAHPNVVSVFRVGTLDGQPYIVSEHLSGKSLDQVPRPLPNAEVLDVGVQLARGLSMAHRKGVLHRDVKPANAFRTEAGECKLLDFGLAKLGDGAGGTPGYGTASLEAAAASAPAGARKPSEIETVAPPSAPLPVTAPPQSPLMQATVLRSTPNHASRSSESPALTQWGAVMGTPLYMAPECSRGEAATRASDVYSLGALLYELSAGNAPLFYLGGKGPEAGARPLAEVAPHADPRLAAIVDQSLAVDPQQRFESAEGLREALERLSTERHPDVAAVDNPYRGLSVFEARHRGVFFGRAAQTREVLDRLRSDGLVVVTGASGEGKSSLARAGVVPAVLEGELGEGRAWQALEWLPGRKPLATLCARLATVTESTESALAQAARQSPTELVRQLLKSLGAGRGLLLLADQLEELTTLGDPADAGDLEVVCAVLAELSLRRPGVRVLATVRADMVVKVQELPTLGEPAIRSLFLLSPMGDEALRDVVVRPAEAKGFAFEAEAMIAELVTLGRSSGALPLLQFALAELWERRDAARGLLTAAALSAMGGAGGALARHADGIIASLPAGQRDAARTVLLRLITAEGTRARRDADELRGLSPDAPAAIEALMRGRLLVARDAERGTGTSHELAHEALVREWPLLREWLQEDDRARVLRGRLESAAAEWERLGRSRELVWGPKQLRQLEGVELGALAPLAATFLSASYRAQRRARVLWATAIGATVVLIGLGITLVRTLSRREINARVGVSLQRADEAEQAWRENESREDDLRTEALSLFADNHWTEAESQWSTVTELGEQLDQLASRRMAALEAAFALAPARDDVRRRLAEALFADALRAHRLENDRQRDLLLERLQAFDDDGTLRARFPAASEVRVAVPGGVTLWLQREGADALSVRSAFHSPQLLEPGHYRLTAEGEGFATVQLPLWVRRGEPQQLDPVIPRAAEIPPGFVLIPAGSFWFGAATGEDKLRRNFFETSPPHQRRTGAYLIARHELTYRDYLQFLDSLPPATQAQRLPHLDANSSGEAVQARVELRRKNGQWEVLLQPTTTPYVARAGEPFVYRDRTVNAKQDWLDFPITALSLDDIEAYAAWLDSTGRVPHARLCTENEWERAARGADERAYPHGEKLAPLDANIDETYGRVDAAFGPDAVGLHPDSNSAYGLSDASGNVWELARSSVDENAWVIRGGSYYVNSVTARVYNRSGVNRSVRHITVGARLCADVSSAPR